MFKRVEAVGFGVDGEARSSDFTEESRGLVNAVFTHVHVLLTYALRPTLHSRQLTDQQHYHHFSNPQQHTIP